VHDVVRALVLQIVIMSHIANLGCAPVLSRTRCESRASHVICYRSAQLGLLCSAVVYLRTFMCKPCAGNLQQQEVRVTSQIYVRIRAPACSYWKGNSSEKELLAVQQQVEQHAWKAQADAGAPHHVSAQLKSCPALHAGCACTDRTPSPDA
jgi:hypothetical protein